MTVLPISKYEPDGTPANRADRQRRIETKRLPPVIYIEAADVGKHYGGNRGVRALDGISLTVAKGEFVSISGPSGCGKTTFLRCIAGIEKPSTGMLKVRQSRRPAARRHGDGVPARHLTRLANHHRQYPFAPSTFVMSCASLTDSGHMNSSGCLGWPISSATIRRNFPAECAARRDLSCADRRSEPSLDG